MAALAGQVRARYPDVAVACCALLRPEVRAAIEATGALAFEDPSRMIRTLGGLAKLRRWPQQSSHWLPLPAARLTSCRLER